MSALKLSTEDESHLTNLSEADTYINALRVHFALPPPPWAGKTYPYPPTASAGHLMRVDRVLTCEAPP